MREVWWPSLPADGPARIWSAACSSGEEVYSIAITLEELTLGKRGYSILGTDISTRVLEAAKRGIYPQPRPDNVPPETLHRWFQRGKASATGYVRVKSSLKSHVRFERVNLMEPIPFPERFHLVFCRNVMIYFNTSDKESLVNRLAQRLLPGGYLMIGHSESLNGLIHPFSYIAPAIYRLDSHE
jgi:chemotaxis protein methyltransferase CheR